MDISDKISVINSLMQEDRNEIRMNKNILLSSTYFILSGVIAITAFYLSQNKEELRSPLLFGLWSLYAVYFIYFFYFMTHLKKLRIYLEGRQEFYTNPKLLEKDPFNPFEIETENIKPSMSHPFLWALPFLTFLVSIVDTIFIIKLP